VRRTIFALAALSAAAPAGAHETAGSGGAGWTFPPAVVAALAVCGVAYVVGVRRLWRRAGTGAGIGVRAAVSFAAGWAALAAALVSPIHELGEARLSWHMAQHELIMLVAAPLLVLGRPATAFLWAFGSGPRRAIGRGGHALARPAAHPVFAWVVFALSLWTWHLPSLYQAALRSETVHAAEHATFLAAALLYWSAVLAGARGRIAVGAEAVSLFGTAFHGALLGALMTVAPTLWYPAYGRRLAGAAALEDQQLAGLWMWVPAGLVFVVCGMGLVGGWLRESERRAGGEAS